MIENKTILITGGTGSFGQELTKVLLEEHDLKAIRIFSRGELQQSEMKRKFNDNPKLRFFIGDVRDKNRVYRATDNVDIIIHAAALKQVPTAEYNPIEAIRTNIDGTTNIIDATIDNHIPKALAISTDKAVHPVNLYGATKLVMERLFTQANVYAGKRESKFSCIRYGNVIGSNGSVIPLFLKQKKTGTITITDETITRFWITLTQGVHFVIDCIERIQGGEIFIPKIPSMKITDLAQVIAPDAKRKIIGIRPGEKVHETLLTEEEAKHTKEFPTYFSVEPEFPFWKKVNAENGKLIPNGFKYTSDNNTWWLSKSNLRDMMEKFQ